VRIGATLSAMLVLLAVPALWRTNAGPPNPGLDDPKYGLGLLIALAAVWLSLLAFAGAARVYRTVSNPKG
jgi:hypothetical protein